MIEQSPNPVDVPPDELHNWDTCDWCNRPYLDRAEYPYCSTRCAVLAELDATENGG